MVDGEENKDVSNGEDSISLISEQRPGQGHI